MRNADSLGERHRAVPERGFSRWILAAAVFGAVCRIAQYAANTSLWLDEAFVALNVISKSGSDIFGLLDWNEPIPLAFLLAEKAVVSVLGRSEYALRLVPLLAGLAGIFAFAALARRIVPSRAACLWAVVLAAASPKLIVQSNEVKHFTLDFLLAVLLIGLAVRISRQGPSAFRMAAWCALSVFGIWLSYASLFVFAGTSLALAPGVLRGWRWRERWLYLAANLAVLASFGLLLKPILAQRSEYVLGFWSSRFPNTASLSALTAWIGRAFLGLFNFFWQPFGAILIVLTVLGAIQFLRRRCAIELSVLWLPVGMSLAASFAHAWPFGGNQHMSFAAPAVLLVAAEGLEEARRRLSSRWPNTGEVLLVLLLAPGVGNALYRIGVPRLRHEMRPVIEFVRNYQEAGDQLFVFCPAEFEYYVGHKAPEIPAKPDPCRRVWIVTAQSRSRTFLRQDLYWRLSRRRPRVLAREEYAAAAYLFDAERCSGE